MIRKHEKKDLDVILDIWYKASTLAHPFLEEEFVKQVKTDMREMYIPNSETWVFEENGKVIGFIGMMGNEIGGLFVSPEYHFKGVGTKLVNYAREKFQELEVEVFEKNKIGRAFYQKYGFVNFKNSMHDETGEEVLRMKFSK